MESKSLKKKKSTLNSKFKSYWIESKPIKNSWKIFKWCFFNLEWGRFGNPRGWKSINGGRYHTDEIIYWRIIVIAQSKGSNDQKSKQNGVLGSNSKIIRTIERSQSTKRTKLRTRIRNQTFNENYGRSRAEISQVQKVYRKPRDNVPKISKKR